MTDPMTRRATRLLMRVVPNWTVKPYSVEYWDRYTSGNDARTALSLACGYTPDQINPARGTCG